MQIDIKTLEKATLDIFNHLRDLEITSFELENDYYWHIVSEERYNPYDKPKDFTLGQLSDDWDEIEKIATGKQEPIGFALVWLAALYLYVGERALG